MRTAVHLLLSIHEPDAEFGRIRRHRGAQRSTREGTAVTTRRSAALMLYRHRHGAVEVFLVHPGGPFWRNKDAGAWSLPKGEYEEGEDPLAAARREFTEETGHAIEGEFRPLEPVRQKGGKLVHAWMVEGDLDAETIRSNTFTVEWPPRSGRMQSFPEADRGAWFGLEEAAIKLLDGQRPLLLELAQRLQEHDR